MARTALAEAWRGQAWIATGVACGTGHIYPYTNYKPLAKFQKALPRGRPTSNSIGSASSWQLSGVSRNTNSRACYLGKVWPQWHNKIRHDQLVDNDVEVFVLFLFFSASGVGEIKDTLEMCRPICFVSRPPSPQVQGWETQCPQYGKRLLFCWALCTRCGNVLSTLKLGAGG